MTLLDQLIEGASGGTLVTTLLRQVKIVASRAEVPALDEWVQHELDGYPDLATPPAYRGPFEVDVLGTFSGPLGSMIKNAPIPSGAFPQNLRDGPLFHQVFHQPIAEIEALSSAKSDLSAPWPANAIAMTNGLIQQGKVSLFQNHGLLEAWAVVPLARLVAMVDAVRTRILDLALTMERANPETGEAGAPPLPVRTKQTIVTNIYGGSPNVAVASSGFSQVLEVRAGDTESLVAYLQNLAVPESDIRDLLQALEEDQSEGLGEGLGPATSTWLSRLLLASRDLGLGTAGGLIADAISRYLGIG